MSQGCSGIDITPLVLSDTFNTWFERTNEIIGSLNDITILGLDPFADGPNTISGLKILPGIDGGCFKRIQLVEGPFVGFTSGSGNTGIYGDGSEENPFKLTLRVGGGESAFGGFGSGDTITGNDMVPVSDTSQGGIFRLAPVATFITQIVGGNNISAVFDNGIYTISYVEVTFNPTFTITPTHTPLREIGLGTARNNQPLTFEISSGNNNLLAEFASVNGPTGTNNNGRVSTDISNFPITLDSSGNGSATTQNVTIPHNTNWFNVSNTTITFTASITSADVTTDTPPTPVNPRQNVSRTRTYSFGWRFGGFASTNQYDANGVQGQDGSFGSMTSGGSSVWNTPQIFQNPTIRRAFTFPITGPQEHYIYFIHSSSSTGGESDTFGWSPRFYNDTGSFEIQGFATELTTANPITLDGKRYRVWRSVDRFTTTSTFQIGT